MRRCLLYSKVTQSYTDIHSFSRYLPSCSITRPWRNFWIMILSFHKLAISPKTQQKATPFSSSSSQKSLNRETVRAEHTHTRTYFFVTRNQAIKRQLFEWDHGTCHEFTFPLYQAHSHGWCMWCQEKPCLQSLPHPPASTKNCIHEGMGSPTLQ